MRKRERNYDEHDSRAALAIAAARAGKHILIEKPLALSITDCEAVATAVTKAGVFLMPAFKMRYYPLTSSCSATGAASSFTTGSKRATFCDGQNTWTEERPEEEGFQRENREFIDALGAGRPPAITAHDGIQATRLVLAADKAIRTGEVQEL